MTLEQLESEMDRLTRLLAQFRAVRDGLDDAYEALAETVASEWAGDPLTGDGTANALRTLYDCPSLVYDLIERDLIAWSDRINSYCYRIALSDQPEE